MSKLKWEVGYRLWIKKPTHPGSWEEIGWVDADGVRYPLLGLHKRYQKTMDKFNSGTFYRHGSIVDLLRDVDNFGCREAHEKGGWLLSMLFAEFEARFSYVQYHLQLSGITDSTKRRIHSLAENF